MEQVTIKEIAEICGVGVSTVSRAINNHPDINPETKERILRVIREHHYVPNNSAQNLKRVASRTIAVLVKGISNPFFGSMIEVLEREVIRKGYTFVLQNVEEEEDEVEAAIRLVKEKRLKGMIFLGGLERHSADRLRLLTIPYVIASVNMELPEEVTGCSVVAIRDQEESRRMVEYLIGQGHRRIAILSASETDSSIGYSRLEGYKQALSLHGLPYDETLVWPSRGNALTYTMENGYETMRELLQSDTEFTCVYAISDTLAIGACKALFDAGKRVPEDVSVAGFDGLEAARFYQPAITTISQPRTEMAQEAVRRLFDLIKKREVKRRVIFDAKLQEGQSVRRLDGPEGKAAAIGKAGRQDGEEVS